MAVERYRYASHPDGDMRAMSLRAALGRVRRFHKVAEEAAKATRKASAPTKGKTLRPARRRR